jgi:hypothetical protein
MLYTLDIEREETIQEKYAAMSPFLDERSRRIWAATEAKALGYGGASLVARVTGISRRAILVGSKELENGAILPEGKIRKPGGGRRTSIVQWNL